MVDFLGGASGKAQSSFSLKFSTYGCDTALEECGDGFECSHHMGWFRVMLSRATSLQFLCTCQLDLVRVSEFRSIETDSVQQTPYNKENPILLHVIYDTLYGLP